MGIMKQLPVFNDFYFAYFSIILNLWFTVQALPDRQDGSGGPAGRP